jgi:hypothetical protein
VTIEELLNLVKAHCVNDVAAHCTTVRDDLLVRSVMHIDPSKDTLTATSPDSCTRTSETRWLCGLQNSKRSVSPMSAVSRAPSSPPATTMVDPRVS